MRKLCSIFVCLIAVSLPSSLRAATITYSTLPGASTAGGPVDVSATFTTSSGALDITLTDLLANPKDVAQLVSSLWFTLSSGQTGTLGSSTGALITVNSGGTYTGPGSNVSTGWVLQTSGTSLVVCVVCPGGNAVAGPAHLLIGGPGPGGTYSNANGSIAGNNAHNPFLFETAQFHITDASINANTLVSSVLFGFGTTGGINVPGFPPNQDFTTPEPSTFALVGFMLLLSVSLLRRRAR